MHTSTLRKDVNQRVALVGLAAACLGGACESAEPTRRDPGEPLAARDSVVLEETDSLYLGDPFRFVVHGDGSFFVTDRFSDRIVRFGSDGRFLSAYGGPGAGPGEFQGVTILVLANDSTVAGYDGMARKFNLFSIGSGKYIRSVETRGIASSAVPMGDSLLLGSTAPDLQTGLEVRALAEGESSRFFGPVPAE